jgi:5-methylcytosine-specific restriction endonuclease McrA
VPGAAFFPARQRRRTWSLEERERVRDASGGDCAICGATLEAFEVDHIQPLSEGGADEFKKLQALCRMCYLQKSEHERLSGLTSKQMFSELQQDVPEGLVDAPGRSRSSTARSLARASPSTRLAAAEIR